MQLTQSAGDRRHIIPLGRAKVVPALSLLTTSQAHTSAVADSDHPRLPDRIRARGSRDRCSSFRLVGAQGWKELGHHHSVSRLIAEPIGDIEGTNVDGLLDRIGNAEVVLLRRLPGYWPKDPRSRLAPNTDLTWWMDRWEG